MESASDELIPLRKPYPCRVLPDGRHLTVAPMTYGKARLYLSAPNDPMDSEAEY